MKVPQDGESDIALPTNFILINHKINSTGLWSVITEQDLIKPTHTEKKTKNYKNLNTIQK